MIYLQDVVVEKQPETARTGTISMIYSIIPCFYLFVNCFWEKEKAPAKMGFSREYETSRK